MSSKNSFSLPQTECPDTDGLVAVVTKGRPGAAWPVDDGWLGCGGSELLSPGKYRAGARREPQRQSQTLGAVACLALLHGALGTLLGQNIPTVVLHFKFGECLGGYILKCPLRLAWPCGGGSRHCLPEACHAPSIALGPSSKKAVSADPLPPKQDTFRLLEQLVGATTVHYLGGLQRMGSAWEGSGATLGHRIIFFW